MVINALNVALIKKGLRSAVIAEANNIQPSVQDVMSQKKVAPAPHRQRCKNKRRS